METGSVGRLAVKRPADVSGWGRIPSAPFRLALLDTVGHAQRPLTSEGGESNLKCEAHRVAAIHAASFTRNQSIHFICLIVCLFVCLLPNVFPKICFVSYIKSQLLCICGMYKPRACAKGKETPG